MSKITYVDKVALNDNPNVNAINKVRDIDMNEIKEVVNNNETKILLAVVDTAPAQCSTGDMYFNTTSKKIFTATGTDTWGNTGEDPTENTLYVVISTQTTYIYDGDTLVSVGGGTGSSDIIMVDPDTPVQDTKLYIESTDLDFQGLEISNTYTTGNNVAYSADYVNPILLWTNSSPTSDFAGQEITLSSSDYDLLEIFFKFSTSASEPVMSVRFPKGSPTRLVYSSTYGGQGGGEMARRNVTYTSATKLTFANGIYQRGTTETSNSNNYAIPIYVVGYKTGLFS